MLQAHIFSILLLKLNRLFHSYYLEAVIVFEMAEHFGKKVGTVLRSCDMRGANRFRMDEIADKMPVDIYVL